MRKLITSSGLFAATVAIGVIVFSCSKQIEPVVPNGDIVFESISVDAIPEGIIPMEFKNRSEALEYLNEIQEYRAKHPVKLIINGDLSMLPILKTRAESSGSTNISIPGWWFQSLNAVFSCDVKGGPITITTSMVGFTVGVGWEQTGYSANWNGAQITYTIYGNEMYYLVIEGIGDVWRHAITVSGTYTPPIFR